MKKFEERTYYWCPKHAKWVLHKPEECRKDEQDNRKSNDEEEMPKPRNTTKQLKKQVLQTVMELSSSDESGEEM